MNITAAHWLPLVCRPKPSGIPLANRIGNLGKAMREAKNVDRFRQVAHASEVFNAAALIASDAGLADLARDLCWRHYDIFTSEGDPEPDLAALALQPVLNIPRQLIRDGAGTYAYELLERLYRAAQQQGAADICGHSVDLSAATRGAENHRKICTQLWAAVLSDGTRALAQAGRWIDAAEVMTAHRGVGHRLLDGRQALVMSLLQRGRPDQAITVLDNTTPTEPWEHTVAAVLRLYCRAQTVSIAGDELDTALGEALTLVEKPEPTTIVFRIRVGLTALDLAGSHVTPRTRRLRHALHHHRADRRLRGSGRTRPRHNSRDDDPRRTPGPRARRQGIRPRARRNRSRSDRRNAGHGGIRRMRTTLTASGQHPGHAGPAPQPAHVITKGGIPHRDPFLLTADRPTPRPLPPCFTVPDLAGLTTLPVHAQRAAWSIRLRCPLW